MLTSAPAQVKPGRRSATETLLLTRSTLEALIEPGQHLADIRRAFVEYRGTAAPGRVHADLPAGVRANALEGNVNLYKGPRAAEPPDGGRPSARVGRPSRS